MTAPAFSEYERAALRAGAKVKRLTLGEKDAFRITPDAFVRAMRGADMAFLCNPNNPTGHALTRDEVMYIAHAAKKEKCLLVVDEAFADFKPECSVMDEESMYLVVLRSMTKFYGMAGLRLGYGVIPKGLIKTFKKHKEPWTVNALAAKAGTAALEDRTFTEKTLKLIQKEKLRMKAGFLEMNIEHFNTSANFFLLKLEKASFVADRLLRHDGIAVRECGNFHGLNEQFIRVAARGREENLKFLEALRIHV